MLSLSLIVFVGFGSNISAYAYSIPGDWFLPYSRVELRNGFKGETHPDADEFVELSDSRFVHMQNPAVTSNGGITWIVKNLSYDSTRDITFILTVRSWNATTLSDFSFYPESLVLGYINHDLSTTWFTVDDVHFFHRDAFNSDQFFGYSVVFTVPADQANSFSRISLSGSGTWPPLGVSLYAYYSDDSSSSVSDLAAILAKLEDIEQSSDEIKGAIEDQYSGDPDQSFNVDDIVTQHNEKMGVLSFSSDVMMDVLGLLSPDQNLSSELVFPSMSLKIANQRQTVQLWPEYRFDLEELAGHWPFLINLMRSITTASVWLLVLRYCYKVFDKYFLAGGS